MGGRSAFCASRAARRISAARRLAAFSAARRASSAAACSAARCSAARRSASLSCSAAALSAAARSAAAIASRRARSSASRRFASASSARFLACASSRRRLRSMISRALAETRGVLSPSRCSTPRRREWDFFSAERGGAGARPRGSSSTKVMSARRLAALILESCLGSGRSAEGTRWGEGEGQRESPGTRRKKRDSPRRWASTETEVRSPSIFRPRRARSRGKCRAYARGLSQPSPPKRQSETGAGARGRRWGQDAVRRRGSGAREPPPCGDDAEKKLPLSTLNGDQHRTSEPVEALVVLQTVVDVVDFVPVNAFRRGHARPAVRAGGPPR